MAIRRASGSMNTWYLLELIAHVLTFLTSLQHENTKNYSFCAIANETKHGFGVSQAWVTKYASTRTYQHISFSRWSAKEILAKITSNPPTHQLFDFLPSLK